MNFSLKQALNVFLIFACAIGVASASIVITNKNNDNTKSKNDSLWHVVESNNSDNDDTSTDSKVGDIVSKTESQVGKYADIDGDGTVDGIIFADLMVGGSGEWNPDNNSWSSEHKTGVYTISTISSCKDYVISQKNYTNELGGTADVLTPTEEGNDRFYVMALKDVDSNYHDWYNAAFYKMNDYTYATRPNFGEGKYNTATIIDKWRNNEYGEKNNCSDHTDLWGEIQDQVNNGWFVPSSAEWAAFGDSLKLTKDNYSTKGLNKWYWSSSQADISDAYLAYFCNGYIFCTNVDGFGKVRLAITF